VVTEPQTHPQTDRTDYNTLFCSLACSVKRSNGNLRFNASEYSKELASLAMHLDCEQLSKFEN